MPSLSLIPVILHEIFAKRTLPREPEPNLVMDDPQQVSAFVAAGRIDGVMAAAYQFHSARISMVIQGCNTVLDLGCGPATQLCQVAALNPDISFIGVDLSSNMLENAKQYAQSLGISNIEFKLADITKLEDFSDNSMDAIISTMTLHHLPTLQHLTDCFASINRVLKPDGALYLTDFGRLKSLKSVIYFAYMNTTNQPHIFTLDYERSLRAAFLKEEFESLTTVNLPKQVELFSTYLVPFLVIVKTEDKPISNDILEKIHFMYQQLPAQYRKELDSLRFFLRLDGLRNDPFILN